VIVLPSGQTVEEEMVQRVWLIIMDTVTAR
jgi:hypothetical protein